MKRIFICLLSVIFSCTVQSQDTTRILDEVIVTATKSPIKQSETGKVVHVITASQLDKSDGRTLGDIMNDLPGIMVNGGTNTPGTNQTIYTRGAASANTLILIDGIPLHTASGVTNEFDLNNFAVSNIEKIEILKGSQSTLYGSDAIAGVVNIITKKTSKKPLTLQAKLSAGSYETYKGSLSVSGTNAKGQTFFAGYSKTSTNGFSSAYDSTGKGNFDNDGFNQDAFQVNLYTPLLKKTTLRLFGNYTNNKADLDAGAFADDKDYTYHNKNTIAGVVIDHRLNRGFVRLQYSYNNFDRSYTDDSISVGGFSKYQQGDYSGISHYTELFTNLKLAANVEFLAGIDYRKQNTDQRYVFYPDYGFPAVPISDDSAQTRQYSGYVSVHVKAKKGFNIELGSRWNHHSIYGTNYTSSINPFFLIGDYTKVYASISSGYRVPSLYQLYSEFGNRKLAPEESTSYETGIQYISDKLKARFTGFIRDGRNVFFFYTDPVNFTSQYRNGDRQHDVGFESEASIRFSDAFKLDVNYTFTDGKLTTSVNGKDSSFNNLYRRPKNVLNLSFSWSGIESLSVIPRLRVVSKSYEPVYMQPPYLVKGYFTLGLYAGYRVNEILSVFTDIENITDEKYFETRGLNSRRFSMNAGIKVTL